MISQVEPILCPDKHGTLEEGQRVQWLKRCISVYHIKMKTTVRKITTKIANIPVQDFNSGYGFHSIMLSVDRSCRKFAHAPQFYEIGCLLGTQHKIEPTTTT